MAAASERGKPDRPKRQNGQHLDVTARQTAEPEVAPQEESSLGENADTLRFKDSKLSQDRINVQGRFPRLVVMRSKIILEQKEVK